MIIPKLPTAQWPLGHSIFQIICPAICWAYVPLYRFTQDVDSLHSPAPSEQPPGGRAVHSVCVGRDAGAQVLAVPPAPGRGLSPCLRAGGAVQRSEHQRGSARRPSLSLPGMSLSVLRFRTTRAQGEGGGSRPRSGWGLFPSWRWAAELGLFRLFSSYIHRTHF